MTTKHDELRWLCVGTGDLVRKRSAAALAQAPGGRLVAVCGGIDRARQIGTPLGAAAFEDMSSALQQSGANAVYIGTPVHRHRDEALRAINAGMHVLVEKPLALSGDEAQQIADAAQKRGVAAACAYYRRLFPRYLLLRDMIRREELGRIVHVRTVNASWFNPAADDVKHWRVEKAQSGGGPLADVGTHMLDLIVGLFGQARSVYALCDTLVQGYDVEDSASLLLTLNNGAHVSAHFGWNTRTWCHEFEVVGSEARVLWRPADTGDLIITRGRDTTNLPCPSHDNVHLPLVQDFNEAVASGRAPACPVDDAVRTNRLLDAVYQSAQQGRPVAPQ
jgi:predicted dehydrogenase